ncbi:MAG: hypothetical protein IJJ19_02755 [Erysipelotrichaceae bacterium]|nr:hypothetical protein [Erysipelotrichaceae bacterium]
MLETKIYIGLNDSQTLKQEHDTSKYVNILKHVCYSYHVPFSFAVQQGGYLHENGDYTEEVSLMLTLIDVPKETINEIAGDLCAFFHQESVLITESEVKAYFINEKL